MAELTYAEYRAQRAALVGPLERKLAEDVMSYAKAHATYKRGDPRWDMVVECYTVQELAEEIAIEKIRHRGQALRYYREYVDLWAEGEGDDRPREDY